MKKKIRSIMEKIEETPKSRFVNLEILVKDSINNTDALEKEMNNTILEIDKYNKLISRFIEQVSNQQNRIQGLIRELESKI